MSDNLDSIKRTEGVYSRSDKLISSVVGELSKSEDVSGCAYEGLANAGTTASESGECTQEFAAAARD